jgi:hypothetical protein
MSMMDDQDQANMADEMQAALEDHADRMTQIMARYGMGPAAADQLDGGDDGG